MCGCRIIREIDHAPPEGATAKERASARASRLKFAEQLQARWGCPAAGRTPPNKLPPDLAEEAALVARTTGIETPSTCPFACLERPDPEVLEVLDAAALAKEFHVPLDEALGRDPTAFDFEALGTLIRSQRAALASDAHIREAEDERRRKTPPPRSSQR